MPFTYSEEARAEAIGKVIVGLRKGTPLTVICSEDGMPTDTCIRLWSEKDDDLAYAIAHAREVGHDQIAMDGMKIVDDLSEDASSRKVRAWYRLQLLAKWDPKRYGDMMKLADADGGKLPALQVAFVSQATDDGG
jgi:hypothetical protein